MVKRMFIAIMPFVLIVAIVQYLLGRDLGNFNVQQIVESAIQAFKFDLWGNLEPLVSGMQVNSSLITSVDSTFWEKVGAFFTLMGQAVISPFYLVYAIAATFGQWIFNVGRFVGIF